MEQLTPIPTPHPPQIRYEAAQKPKRAIFPSLIWGGGEEGGSLGFLFIFSKIVGIQETRWKHKEMRLLK